ncbi:MAG TPA: hypothetical protein VN706_25675 [Gemmatimonadaceae bacterium]|nr:hypothetical protein [Gemmatimonadaceae bacterium]
MTAPADGHGAAEILLHDKESLARAITANLYAELPELMEKHGARGRAKCLEDMHYNIEHLIPAVDLQQPGMFAQYVRWLDSMLRARGVATRDVRRCLELLRDETHARYAESDARAIATVIDAGLATLSADAGG